MSSRAGSRGSGPNGSTAWCCAGGNGAGDPLRIDEAATAERRAGTEPAAEGYGPGEVHPLGRLLKAPGNGADAGRSPT